MIESFEDRKRIIEKFYGKRGSSLEELLDEFMLKSKVEVHIRGEACN